MKASHLSLLLATSFTFTVSLLAAAADREGVPKPPKDPAGIAPPGEPEIVPRSPKIPEPVAPLATEQDFVMLALRGGRAEVRLAELAQTKAAGAKVREFAATMVKDHTTANAELKSIADDMKVLLPDVPDKEVEAKYKRLSELTGDKFDIAFLMEVASGHGDDLTLYERGKKIAKTKEVSAFIEKMIPVIKTHIEVVSALTKKSAP